MTLRPDGGGAIVATSVIAAQGGVALNNTILAEPMVTTLLNIMTTINNIQNCLPPNGQLVISNGSLSCFCNNGWTGLSCTSFYSTFFNFSTCGSYGSTGPLFSTVSVVTT